MKNNLSILALSLFTLSACYSQKVDTKSSEMKENMKTIKMDGTHSIDLKKGELFLVAIADQKEGKEQLLQEYFGTIMPSAMKNGFTPLGQLHIDQVVKADGYAPNNFIGLFKWPNMESIQAFMTDFSPEELKELRMPIWNEFKAHMIALKRDETFRIDENKLYEVKTIWSKEIIDTNSILENGGRVILNQSIVGYEDLHGNEAPNHIMIIEWEDQKSAKKFRKMKLLKAQKEESFYTHFTLFPR
jgi:hypothetical protein